MSDKYEDVHGEDFVAVVPQGVKNRELTTEDVRSLVTSSGVPDTAFATWLMQIDNDAYLRVWIDGEST